MLDDFNNTFQQKMPMTIFEKEFSAFIEKDIKQKNSLTEKKGIGLACDEISALLQLAKHYKATHLKWTGNQKSNCPFDGILFFNRKHEQKVEVSRVLDEEENESLKETGYFSRTFIFEGSDFNINLKKANKNLDIRSFIYHRIVKILTKKEKEKYKGFWLCIAYYPYSITSKFNEEYVKKSILKKIECEQKPLLYQIRKLFKKIIFVPNGMHFIKVEKNTYKIFEWK